MFDGPTRERIWTLTNECLDKAREYFPDEAERIRKPFIGFNLTGTSAGRAIYSQRKIVLNPHIFKGLSEEAQQEFIDETIPHEVAHIVAYQVHRHSQAHNAKWGEIMKLFGFEDWRSQITHCLPVDNVPSLKRRKSLKCPQCAASWTVTPKKAARFRRGEVSYQCPRCRVRLIIE